MHNDIGISLDDRTWASDHVNRFFPGAFSKHNTYFDTAQNPFHESFSYFYKDKTTIFADGTYNPINFLARFKAIDRYQKMHRKNPRKAIKKL